MAMQAVIDDQYEIKTVHFNARRINASLGLFCSAVKRRTAFSQPVYIECTLCLIMVLRTFCQKRAAKNGRKRLMTAGYLYSIFAFARHYLNQCNQEEDSVQSKVTDWHAPSTKISVNHKLSSSVRF